MRWSASSPNFFTDLGSLFVEEEHSPDLCFPKEFVTANSRRGSHFILGRRNIRVETQKSDLLASPPACAGMSTQTAMRKGNL
jgi:hypothetical protein